MRIPIIAGNWKLHKSVSEALDLVQQIEAGIAGHDGVDVIVAPVYTALYPVGQSLAKSRIRLAGQNCYPMASGAFTGEVSAPLLKDAGCSAVILGHSERRQLFGEDDALINRKVKAALETGLQVILCVGETLQEREEERMYDVLTCQVRDGLAGVDAAGMQHVVIAYEPVWAIGTGKVASDEQAQEAHVFIRGLLGGLYDPQVSDATRILYGGSVKPENVDGLLAQEDVDGALVGGASLKAEDFIRLVRFRRS